MTVSKAPLSDGSPKSLWQQSGARPAASSAGAMPTPPLEVLRYQRHEQALVSMLAECYLQGVAANGSREYLGVWLGTAESGPAWSTVFKDLHQRGLTGVQYVVSDEHTGLKAAVQRFFPAAVHQRCQVHYLRNALTRVSTPTWQAMLLAALRDVWAAPTRPEATARAQQLVATLRHPLPSVAAWPDETLDDTLGFYAPGEAEARRRLRTTNALEREHEEIRRRTRVIRILPNEASYLRLATALAADRSDSWAKRHYIIPASPTINVRHALCGRNVA